MSHLYLTGHLDIEFKLNVIQFHSPMSSQIVSAQTRMMEHHFPIRCGQPDIQFTVQFSTLNEKHRFQNFVRDHQTRLPIDPDPNEINLWWPERNIENWTGYISTMKVVEKRFEYAPFVTFGVDLINSLMSTKTTISSSGPGFQSIFGPQIRPWIDAIDNILNLPSVAFNEVNNMVNDNNGGGT